MSKKTKRRDHYIPQGYLRGFIDPSREDHPRPLWCFDVARNTWRPRSTKEVGHRKGFYDYAGVGTFLETQSADSAFLKLENDYPIIRDAIISNGFARWSEHRDFLLSFMQMMRARSLLFREQKQIEGKNILAWEVAEVGSDNKSLKLKSMTPSPVSPMFIRNRAITQMREEIQKGADWLKDFDWALRCCDSVTRPFIISEMPLIADVPCADMAEAIKHPDSLLMFPLCWQACLFGSRQSFDVKLDKFGPEDMQRVRERYIKTAKLFLLSPIKLDELSGRLSGRASSRPFGVEP